MYKKEEKGFTLIELLVVIAIIGILSSIVLASLSVARGKAIDARIKAEFSSIRQTSIIYYDNKGGYEPVNDQSNGDLLGVCEDQTFVSVMKKLDPTYAGSANTGSTVECNDGEGYWLATAPLQNTAVLWCADYTGFVGEISYITPIPDAWCTCSGLTSNCPAP